MTEKPRTWTLLGDDVSVAGCDEFQAVEGPSLKGQGDVPVIELEPVLDLLERLRPWLPQVQTVQPGNRVFKTAEEVDVLLREHGRLK